MDWRRAGYPPPPGFTAEDARLATEGNPYMLARLAEEHWSPGKVAERTASLKELLYFVNSLTSARHSPPIINLRRQICVTRFYQTKIFELYDSKLFLHSRSISLEDYQLRVLFTSCRVKFNLETCTRTNGKA